MKRPLVALAVFLPVSIFGACTLKEVEFCEYKPGHWSCQDAGGSDGGPDGSIDAAADVGSDSSSDGSDAGPECTEDADCTARGLVCDGEACVACRDDAAEVDPGCPKETPYCDGPSRRCRECRSSQDCTADPQRPRCEVGTCVACEPGGGECATVGVCFADDAGTTGDDALASTAAGSCVPCNDDVDCGEGACDVWSHACVTPEGDVGQCGSCATDADCEGDAQCVEVRFPTDSEDPTDIVGTYCTADCTGQEDLFCGSYQGRAVGYACRPATTRSGQNSQFCVPASTTCEGYLAHDRLECEGAQGICSHDGDGGDLDGVCLGSRCSYPCASSSDCPGGYDCGQDIVGYCDLN